MCLTCEKNIKSHHLNKKALKDWIFKVDVKFLSRFFCAFWKVKQNMRPFNFRSRDTTHCHQVVLVPGEESDGTTSTLGEAAFSPTTLNTAEAPALFCVRSKMSVPWGVTGEPRPQIPAWQSSTSATPFGVPAAPRHSPHKAQLQLGLGPTALVLSYYFVKLPECPWGMQAGKGKQGFFFFFFTSCISSKREQNVTKERHQN